MGKVEELLSVMSFRNVKLKQQIAQFSVSFDVLLQKYTAPGGNYLLTGSHCYVVRKKQTLFGFIIIYLNLLANLPGMPISNVQPNKWTVA